MKTARKRKTKTPNIRPGDVIEVLKPDFFVRCGYPMHFPDEVERIKAEKMQEIIAFLKSQGVDMRGRDWLVDSFNERPFDKVAKTIAYELIRQNSFGGNKREIHTVSKPEFSGQKAVVQGVRFVKTGIHCAGGPGFEGEYDPSYLANEKSHRLLQLSRNSGILSEHGDSLWIDAENVKLMEDRQDG